MCIYKCKKKITYIEWKIEFKLYEEVTIMRKELLKGLTDEQIAKVEACKSSEEILWLRKKGLH